MKARVVSIALLAVAVLILNDHDTGYPFACLESSVISATRTAAKTDGVTGVTDRRPDSLRGRRHQSLVALAFVSMKEGRVSSSGR